MRSAVARTTGLPPADSSASTSSTRLPGRGTLELSTSGSIGTGARNSIVMRAVHMPAAPVCSTSLAKRAAGAPPC